jgi:hypothetical protein
VPARGGPDQLDGGLLEGILGASGAQPACQSPGGFGMPLPQRSQEGAISTLGGMTGLEGDEIIPVGIAGHGPRIGAGVCREGAGTAHTCLLQAELVLTHKLPQSGPDTHVSVVP